MNEFESPYNDSPIPEEALATVSGGESGYDDDKPEILYRITCENPSCAGWHRINVTADEVLRERTFGCPQCHTNKFLLVTPM